MAGRKIIVCIVVAAALGAGVVMRNRSFWAMGVRQAVLRGSASLLRGDSSLHKSEKVLLKSYYERLGSLSGDERLALGMGSQEELLRYAEQRRDRPERLWRWLAGEPYRLRDPGSTAVPPPDLPWTMGVRAAVTERYRFMRDRDPDNGWPLLQLAYMAASRSVRYLLPEGASSPRRITVSDTESMAEAARLLHEAVGKGRLTLYALESLANGFEAVGEPETFEDGIMGRRLARYLTDNLDMHTMWSVCDFLVAESARRLEDATESAEKRSAYAILHDLQTVGALAVADAASQSVQDIGFGCIITATEKGVALLNRAGMTAEAETLLARGVALARPRLISNLAAYSTGDEVWRQVEGLNDEITREARRLDGLERSLEATEDAFPIYSLFSLNIPFYREISPDGEKRLTVENVRATLSFNCWAWEKDWSNLLWTLAWAILTVLLVVAGIERLAAKGPFPEVPWPSPRRMLVASVMFAGPAVVPGLAASAIASGGGMPPAGFMLWNAGGFLAGAMLLWWWAHSRDTMEADGTLPGGPGLSAGWFVLAAFGVLLPLASMGCITPPCRC